MAAFLLEDGATLLLEDGSDLLLEGSAPPASGIGAVPGTDALWLGAWLDAVLARAAVVLGADAPARRYVSAGEPVPDCDQLTVHVERLRTGAGAFNELTRPQVLPKASLLVVTVAEVQITLWRCTGAAIQDGDPPRLPTAAALHDAGITMARLGQALWYGLTQESIDGTLWPLQVKPVVLWRAATQVAPQAGIAAWKMTGEVSLT